MPSAIDPCMLWALEIALHRILLANARSDGLRRSFWTDVGAILGGSGIENPCFVFSKTIIFKESAFAVRCTPKAVQMS